VYAIHGVWGSGKSSAINLVLHHLAAPIKAGDIVATTFNPWWFSGSEALTISFFRELRETVGKSLDEKAREAIASLGGRLSSAGPLLGGLTSLVAIPVAGAAVKGGITLLENLTRLESTVEKEHRKLVEALAKQNKRFLIVLDDVDRLGTDDALQMFKLVKSAGRLPNVVYLMAFDRYLADKMVAERYPAEGSSYLEKVIQGAFNVPVPDRDDLCNQLLVTVEAVMGTPPTEKIQRFWNLFHDGVAPLLKTPRDAVRLSNTIRVSWPPVSGDVDRADFLTLEAMRLFLPTTYEAVRAHPDMLTGTQPTGQQRTPNLEEEYNETFLSHVTASRERAIAKRTLRRLFPRLDAVWSNFRSSGNKDWRRDRLVCTNEHFGTYFAFSVINNGITTAESDTLVAAAGKLGATASALRRFLAMPRRKGGTRAALALDELAVRAGDIADADIRQFVTDIFSVADDLNIPVDKGHGFRFNSNNIRIHGLLNSVLLDRLELPDRSAIVRAAAPGASLDWLIDFSDRCKSISEKEGITEDRGENFADDETVTWLHKLSHDRILAAAANGALLKSADLAFLLYRWRDRAGHMEVRAWTDCQLENDGFIVTLAGSLVMESWSAGLGGLGDVTARKAEYVHLEPLSDLLDLERFKARVVTLHGLSTTGDEHTAILRRFLDAPNRNPQNF